MEQNKQRSEIIGTGNNFQQKAKSQNSWKHDLLPFGEITYLIVKLLLALSVLR